MVERWVDWSKNARSKNYRGSGSFATFMIIGPVCFFLGVLFASFPYDFPLLWTSDPVPPAYFDQLETHLRFVHQSPPLIARMLNIIVSVGLLGFFIKLFKPSEANVLFDGASLVLYIIGVGVYVANIVKGLRAVSADIWSDASLAAAAAAAAAATSNGDGPSAATGQVLLGREDSLRVLSASNTILALVLVGVLVLQAGQWYAERKELDDYEQAEKADGDSSGNNNNNHGNNGKREKGDKREAAERKEGGKASASTKKKQ